MKRIKTFAILFALTAAPVAFAAGFVSGTDTKPADRAKQSPKPVAAEIRKIRLDTGKVIFKHGAIDNLGMGTMTMAFVVKGKASLKNFKEGQSVLTVFDMVDGQPTVMDLRSKQAIGGARPIGRVPPQSMAAISRTGFSP